MFATNICNEWIHLMTLFYALPSLHFRYIQQNIDGETKQSAHICFVTIIGNIPEKCANYVSDNP